METFFKRFMLLCVVLIIINLCRVLEIPSSLDQWITIQSIESKTVSELVLALQNDDRTVRRRAADRLYEIGKDAKFSSEELFILFEVFEEESGDVNLEVARILRNLDPIPKELLPHLIASLEKADHETLKRILRWIRKIGPAAIDATPVLIKKLATDDFNVRFLVAEAIGAIGVNAIPLLIEALDNENPMVRSEASSVLGRMGANANEAIPHLIRLLDDENKEVRFNASLALAKIGEKARPSLIKALQDTNKYVRSGAVFALVEIAGQSRNEQVVSFLKEAAKEEETVVRVAAVIALGHIGKEAIPTLEIAARD